MILPHILAQSPRIGVWLHTYWSSVVRKPRRYRPQPNPVAPRVRKMEIDDQSMLLVYVEGLTSGDMADLSGALSAFMAREPQVFGSVPVAGIRVLEFVHAAAA